MRLALSILLCAVASNAATIAAKQDGYWHDTNTWAGTVLPTLADNVQIPGDRVITNAAGTTQQVAQVLMPTTNNTNGVATLVIEGMLIQGNSQFIAIGNGASRDGKLLMMPGGTIIATNNLYCRNGYFESLATRENPAIIMGGGIGNATVSLPRQQWRWTNVVMRNTGSSSFFVQDGTGLSSGASFLYFVNCTFPTNGTISFGSAVTPSATPMWITDTDIRTLGGTRTVSMTYSNDGPASGGFRRITGKQIVSGVNVMRFAAAGTTNITFDTMVLDNANIYENLAPMIGGSIITNCFMTSRQSSQSFVQFNNSNGVTVINNYVRPSANNGNGLSTTGGAGNGGTNLIEGNVFEGIVDGVTFAGRPDFYLPNATPLPSIFRLNLTLNSETCVGANFPNWKTLDAKRNTLVATTWSLSTDAGGSLWINENVTASGGVINYANNIARGNNNAGGIAIGGSGSGGTNQLIAYSDYNNFTQFANTYTTSTQLVVVSGNTGKVVPGSQDVAFNPIFFDESRNLTNWNSRFGSGTADSENAITYLLSINGFDDATGAQTGTQSSRGVAHLWRWVREGYTTTNLKLRRAGDPSDGNPDIGIGAQTDATVSAHFF